MARGFGDLEAVIMDRVWARSGPVTVRELFDELRRERPIAYTTVMSSIWLHLGFFAAIPVAFIVTALIGLAIERLIVRHLYGRLLDTLLRRQRHEPAIDVAERTLIRGVAGVAEPPRQRGFQSDSHAVIIARTRYPTDSHVLWAHNPTF